MKQSNLRISFVTAAVTLVQVFASFQALSALPWLSVLLCSVFSAFFLLF
jgi:hypothetical protein